MFRKPTHITCIVVYKKNYIVTTNDWEYSLKLASIDQISNGMNNATDGRPLIASFTRILTGGYGIYSSKLSHSSEISLAYSMVYLS